MSQTLLILDNQPLVDLLGLNLPTYVGTDVVSKKNFKEAQLLMEHHPGIHLIVCADKIGAEATADLVHQMNQKHKRPSDMIVLGAKSKVPASTHVINLQDKAELKDIVQAAAKLLKVTPKKMMEMAVPDFYPVLANFCINMKKAPCAIFVLSGDSDYQKKYAEGDPVHSEEIKMLIEADHGTLYVEAANRLKFVNHVTVGLVSRLKDKNLTPEERISASEEALQIVKDDILKGTDPVSKATEELASVAIKNCLEIAEKNPTVASLLKRLFANRAGFLYRHTQLIIYLTQHILNHVEWGSNEQKEKLAFVAFFHDLCLTEDRHAKYHSDFAVSTDETLSMMEKESILKHARSSAEIVQRFSTAPIGADVIIMQHHGMTSGQGFAKSFTNSISPLAIVFMIAEEMSHLILELEHIDQLAAHRDEFLAKLSQKYPRSNYQRIIETLKALPAS